MADRFSGTVAFGGKLTREQVTKCSELLDLSVGYELSDNNGMADFNECTSEDFADVIRHCKEHKIALMIQWEGKAEYGSQCEYWIDGKYQQFDTNTSGSIVVTVEDLEVSPYKLLCDFIESLGIPKFPEFSIGEPEEQPTIELLPADKPRYLTPAGVECTIIRQNDHSVTLLIADAARNESYEWTTDRANFEKRYKLLRSVTLYFSDGKASTNTIGEDDDIADHFLGKTIESGSDSIALCVQFNDTKETLGLQIKSIENGNYEGIKCVRVENVKVDDEKSFVEIMLDCLSGDVYALNDVWVYDRNGEWIKTVGYRHETVKR